MRFLWVAVALLALASCAPRQSEIVPMTYCPDAAAPPPPPPARPSAPPPAEPDAGS